MLMSPYSSDPLAWVQGNAGSAAGSPSEVAANVDAVASGPAGSTGGAANRAAAAANAAVLDVLAQGVVRACDLLHRARIGSVDDSSEVGTDGLCPPRHGRLFNSRLRVQYAFHNGASTVNQASVHDG